MTISLPGCMLDLRDRTATVGGTTHRLTHREVTVLELLIARSGSPVAREELETSIWGMSSASRSEAVPVAMRRLRAKLCSDEHEPLETIRGFGWKITVETEALPGDALIAQIRTAGPMAAVWGPGGVGKTTVLRRALSSDGLYLDLCNMTGVEQVRQAFADKLGTRIASTEELLRILRHLSPDMLVLDHAESVVDLWDEVADWMDAGLTCPIRVGTRNRPIRSDAVVIAVPLLSPSDGAALFQASIRRRGIQWTPAPEAVEQLVASTEGLPLAIELAAARCQVLSIEEVTKRIQTGTAKLRDRTRAGRHGCLLACVQESIGALQPATQQALARLCALPTDLDYGLAVEFTGDEAHIEALLDAALLYKQDTDGRLVFRVYRQVKNVATVSPATRDEAMEALTAAVAPRTSTICARWIDDGDMTALEDLKSMVPHLRAIATWALESGRIGDAVLALRRLYTWVCSGRGHPEQLRLWVLRCLAEGVEGVDRARLLLAAAGLESMAGQKDASRAHLEEALSLETSPELRHRILVMHARTLPIEQGITQLRQLLELPMRPTLHARVRYDLAMTLVRADHHDEAKVILDRLMRESAELGLAEMAAYCESARGTSAQDQGHYPAAARHFARSAEMLETLQLERHALHIRLMWMEARIQCGEAVESSELEAMRRSAERQFFWRGVAMVETLQAQLDGAGS